MITTLGFLNPMVTEGALLKLATFGEFLKGNIVFAFSITYLIFFTGLTLMENYPTI
jgi:hypothetical protein